MGADDGLGEKETEGWNERKRWGRDYMSRGGDERNKERRRILCKYHIMLFKSPDCLLDDI